ncbi:hypothetical protein QPL79_06200 [Ignisphaera sp. 4213-co]|uniref:Uncharacterized protein n=1 Tax=Ignisphaera cupida TaxID=3050454 RepID=A0ABD4Z7V0_9CREN|nr:hypothetical protein [Ignisphaera sp. 4213-co]MDK6028950.1 hypothetical protein [Ignisphaera sp. 4213-co]
MSIVSWDIVLGISMYLIAVVLAIVYAIKSKNGYSEDNVCGESR